MQKEKTMNDSDFVNLSGYKILKNDFEAMNPFDRHKLMMSLHSLEKTKDKESNRFMTDYDILKKKYRFIHDATTEQNSLLRNYYNSICKRFTICNLSRYKESIIGMRWRKEDEIFSGKGHIICASENCNSKKLKSYKFLFRYEEEGKEKETDVRVRLCMACASKLYYKKLKKYMKILKKQKKKEKKKKKKQKSKKEKKRKENEEENGNKHNTKTDQYTSEEQSTDSEEKNNSSLSSSEKKRKQVDNARCHIEQKLNKLSLKNEEDKTENNILFHDLLL